MEAFMWKCWGKYREIALCTLEIDWKCHPSCLLKDPKHYSIVVDKVCVYRFRFVLSFTHHCCWIIFSIYYSIMPLNRSSYLHSNYIMTLHCNIEMKQLILQCCIYDLKLAITISIFKISLKISCRDWEAGQPLVPINVH